MRPFTNVRIAGCIATAALAAPVAAQPDEWTFDAFIRISYNNTLFMARDQQDNVYVTSFNSAAKSADVVAFKITGATGAEPKATVFDRFPTPSTRGYSGIAVDAKGNIYVSADQGDGAPSFIKKFGPDLKPDQSFGSAGALVSNKIRVQGLACHENTLIAAVNWGRFAVIDETGKFLGMTTERPGEQKATIRDIDVVPSKQEVLGVDSDTIYVFRGSGFSDLGSYSLTTLAKGNGRQAAGSAIYYHQATDSVFYNLNQGRRIAVLGRNSRRVEVLQSVTGEHGPQQPADVVISSDGKTMFVSDLRGAHVARYRSGGKQTTSIAAAAALPEATPAPGETSAQTTQTADVTAADLEQKLSLAELQEPSHVVAAPQSQKPAIQGASSFPGEAVPPRLPDVGVTTSPPATTTASAPAAGADMETLSPNIPWSGGLDAARGKASAEKKKIAAFFFSPESEVSQQINKTVFSDPAFATKYPDILWAAENVSSNPDLMRSHKILKVPVLILFSPDGKESKRFEGMFSAEVFALAYSQLP